MDTSYLSTWSTILQVAATESSSPIASFDDPVQALRQMYRQNAAGDNIQVITNDGESYWLVSATLAAKLYKSNFYPMLGASYLPEKNQAEELVPTPTRAFIDGIADTSLYQNKPETHRAGLGSRSAVSGRQW